MEINKKKRNKERQALIVRKYREYLKLEKGLSPNTLEAYLTDLDKLMSFLTLEGIDFLEVCLADLQRFAAGLHDIGIHARSQARIISGVKSFFRFLLMSDYLEADPSELLESPKIGFKLPEVLSVAEIDAIISAVDRSKPKDSATGLFWKHFIVVGCVCRSLSTSNYPTSISTKGLSRWREKEVNSGWFPYHHAPYTNSDSISPTATALK